MTKEQAKELLPVLQAWVEGKTIQFKSQYTNCLWQDIECPSFESDCSYRIKPEPKLRPWKPEEVPVGAIIKSGNNRWLITAVWNGKIFLNGCDKHDDERSPSLANLTNKGYTHSLDHGKTWLPCGVIE